MSVITRVTSALIRSLASVASSVDLGLGRRGPKKEFQNDSKQPPKDSPRQNSSQKKDSAPSEITEEPLLEFNQAEDVAETEPKKIELSFLQLIQTLKQKANPIASQGGAKAYQATLRNQKKTGRVRKGTMLDTESS